MGEIYSLNSLVLVPTSAIEGTLSELQSAGHRECERVVLWLGGRKDGRIHIESLWVPEQEAGYDFFEIPQQAMQALFGELRNRRLMVAAQVHTHPHRAFHSHADDKWAIVRHTGALSLVLPYFAVRTEPSTFAHDAALFILSPTNKWLEAAGADVQNFYQISP
jgi:proteasome lid subunit RPN8/RPN11